MKHTFTIAFLLLLIVMAGPVRAQKYENVLKTDLTSWIMYHGELEYYMKDRAYVQNTNGTNNLYYWGGYEFLTYIDFVGTVREEDGRLWITYADNPNNEILYIDMNLEVGDEFAFTAYYTGTVVEIRYENGRKIIVFDRPSINWFQEPMMFIEGIGRNFMTFGWYCSWDYCYQSCKFDNQELAYSTGNSHFENCELLTTSVNDFTNHSSLEIYPNPAKNNFKISPENLQQPYVVNIFNSNGVLVKTIQGVGETFVSSEQLENGLYLLEIICHDKIHNEKIIINK